MKTKPSEQYSRAACRQIPDNAERQKLPRPVIAFVFNDDDDCEYGPFVFPTLPRKGEFIQPEWLGKNNASWCDASYEVIGVEHCVPDGFPCEVPFVYLWVIRNEHYWSSMHSRR
jgi:hypothetical protein